MVAVELARSMGPQFEPGFGATRFHLGERTMDGFLAATAPTLVRAGQTRLLVTGEPRSAQYTTIARRDLGLFASRSPSGLNAVGITKSWEGVQGAFGYQASLGLGQTDTGRTVAIGHLITGTQKVQEDGSVVRFQSRTLVGPTLAEHKRDPASPDFIVGGKVELQREHLERRRGRAPLVHRYDLSVDSAWWAGNAPVASARAIRSAEDRYVRVPDRIEQSWRLTGTALGTSDDEAMLRPRPIFGGVGIELNHNWMFFLKKPTGDEIVRPVAMVDAGLGLGAGWEGRDRYLRAVPVFMIRYPVAGGLLEASWHPRGNLAGMFGAEHGIGRNVKFNVMYSARF